MPTALVAIVASESITPKSSATSDRRAKERRRGRKWRMLEEERLEWETKKTEDKQNKTRNIEVGDRESERPPD
jgi:hypothetical protein